MSHSGGRSAASPSATADPAARVRGAGVARVCHRVVNSPGLAVSITSALLVATTALVHVLGGTQHATPHLYYVAMIFAALTLGKRGALATAGAAALLAGLVPLDTVSGTLQSPASIALRAAVFLVITCAVLTVLIARERLDEENYTGALRMLFADPDDVEPEDTVSAARATAALRNGDFVTVFQPIYSLDTGDLVAVEALTRFAGGPPHGPDAWFTAAHAAGIGIDLEVAAARSAIGHAADLPTGVSLAINVGPEALSDPRIASLVRDNRGRVALTLELTEHAAISDYDDVQRSIARLREAGAQIAVDDVGAGISSLRHVLRLRPDVVKIDGSLATDIARSPARMTLGRTLVDFGHEAGATVVIEGIESEGDLESWSELGADEVQGYLTGRPGALPVQPRSAHILRALGGRSRRRVMGSLVAGSRVHDADRAH